MKPYTLEWHLHQYGIARVNLVKIFNNPNKSALDVVKYSDFVDWYEKRIINKYAQDEQK